MALKKHFSARWLAERSDAELEFFRHELALEVKRYPRELKHDVAARNGLNEIKRQIRARR